MHTADLAHILDQEPSPMQQPDSPNPRSPRRAARHSPHSVRAAVLALLLAGCTPEQPKPGAGGPAKPFADVSLTLRCPDRALAEVLAPAVNSWADRTGAAVSVRVEPMAAGDDTDAGVIPAASLGSWADRGELAPVPDALRTPDHPFQWTSVAAPYRERLIEWGGQARAVPLAGDGLVVVYRADRLADPKFAAAFRAQFGRDPAAPSTWEEFADLAVAFAALDGRPSLPATTGAELADLFFRVAACYDRPALNDSATAELIKQLGPAAITRLASFQFAADGSPRLGEPAFTAAAQLLGRLTAGKCLPPPPSDPSAARGDADAALAVLPLARLAGLRGADRAVPPRFGVAALPGAKWYTDPKGGGRVPAAANYIPYFAGGRLGVVRTRCARPEAAFDLLADLGGPTRSLEVVGTPGLGAGPFRSTHLERDRLPIWLGYGFDAERSKGLQEALRQYVRPDVRDAVYGLRGPDREVLDAAAADVFAKVLAGSVPADAAPKQLLDAWKQIDEKTPKETLQRWRTLAAGVQ